MQIFAHLEVSKNLNTLELTLVSRKILFKKVTLMPKGHIPKLKDSTCNIPIETASIVNTLPHDADSSGLVMVKLKRKLSFRDHVYSLRENCPNTELFLVRIQRNTDQK